MRKGQELGLRRKMEREWAKRVYGARWRRAFNGGKRGDGTLIHGVSAYRAGWADCAEIVLEMIRKYGPDPLP